jgi:hypothetical protein
MVSWEGSRNSHGLTKDYPLHLPGGLSKTMKKYSSDSWCPGQYSKCNGLLSHLSVCDYFLWGYFKAKVFINRPRTVHELKVAIEQEIAAIHGKMLNEQLQDEAARMHMKTW